MPRPRPSKPAKPAAGTPVADGLTAAGQWLGKAAVGAGRSMANAYRAIDPDLRRHLAQMPLAGLSLLTARERVIEALPGDGHPPVIFVHGLGGRRGNFLGMQALFALSGRKRTYALGLDGDATLEQMAMALQRTIREVVEVNALGKKEPVQLVAHSMGGLVARLAVQDKATRARIRTLVTLGTPHGGTFAARYGATSVLRALRPGSPTLRALQRQEPWKGRPKLVCLWSANDVFLLPATSACLEGATNLEMPGFTHYSYLLEPRAAQAVLTALAH